MANRAAAKERDHHCPPLPSYYVQFTTPNFTDNFDEAIRRWFTYLRQVARI